MKRPLLNRLIPLPVLASASSLFAEAPAPASPASAKVAQQPADEVPPILPVTEALAKANGLDPFYRKSISVHGFLVVGSDKVYDPALKEAAYLIDRMIGHRPDILKVLADRKIHFTVMACEEMTTDIPEESTLKPKAFWDVRARGLGAMLSRPAVSCGEENLLRLEGNPYYTQNLLIHEFSHAIDEIALAAIDPGFDNRLRVAFRHAKMKGLWQNTYSMQHYREYWAEAVQSWFDCSATNDLEHGPIGTREQLRAYDPEICKLLVEIFGDTPWRYTKPATRLGRPHLAGFDPRTAPKFQWPEGLKTLEQFGPMLPWMEARDLPPRPVAAEGRTPSVVNFINRRGLPLVAERLADEKGAVAETVSIPADAIIEHRSFDGAVWRFMENGRAVGGTVLQGRLGRLEIR